MKKNRAKETAEKILKLAGIKINGSNPWDIKVKNEAVFQKTLAQGSLGAGETYMNGWWECEQIDELVDRVIRAQLPEKIKNDKKLIYNIFVSYIFNRQTKSQAARDVGGHYNIGNDLYKNMLDKRMIYTCGYWKHARSLDEAQEAKLDLICQKLDFKPGQKILDIGCGWGGFVKYAAEKYKVKAVGITLSKEQVKIAKESCKGLPVEIRLQDYRDVNEKFDYIISVGMIEHVGYKNYRTYMKVVNQCLKDDGLFLLHTIGVNTSVTSTDLWINKYIFPNGMLPSISQIGTSIEGLFVMEDWHNFSADYDKTLIAWYCNFENNWHKIKKHGYDERFYRMWKFYLLTCAGAFRARRNQLWQIVLSKKGVVGGYKSIR